MTLLMLLLGALSANAQPAAPVLDVKNLRCDHRQNPLAVHSVNPKLSWVIENGNGVRSQSAYRVMVASSPELLSADRGDLWDSGKVVSDESINVRYTGRQLPSLAQCWWKVRVWDDRGRASAWSKPARWSMGLLKPDDWEGKWIADPAYQPSHPMPLFRKSIDIPAGVLRAVVYVCGLGQCEVQINGRPVTDAVMEPGWTNYRKSCPYVAYDVTSLLSAGENVVGVMLGNGMYNVTGGRYVKFTGSYGEPKVILQMHITCSDGTSSVVSTDGTWKVSPGPVTFSCTYGGEDYDATREMWGWSAPRFDDSAWASAEVVDGPGGELVARVSQPIKAHHTYKPVSVTEVGAGIRVYDLAQNMSGLPVLRVTGPAGSRVKITPNETWSGSGPIQPWLPVSFTYTLKGKGIETWRPRFTYYGFRYVQVELLPAEDGRLPRVLDLSADFIHTAASVAGEFSCSNETVNRIHRLINMAILSNYQSVLTDCPQREKLGWLEQAHLVFGGITSNYDSAAFYAKIMRDMAEAQLDNGLVPDIAPEYTVFADGFRDSPEWGSAYVLCPWFVYENYGDRSLLEEHYDGMKKYVMYLKSRSDGGVVSHGLGDWYDVGPNPPGGSQLTSRGLTATATYYQDIVVMKRASELLGKAADEEFWENLRHEVHSAFNSRFYHPGSCTYDTGSQTANAMPLVVGLVNPEHRQGVTDALVRTVQEGRNRVTAGDVGFKYLVRALSEAGRDDVLWDVVTQSEGPGYVYQLNRGATSLTEAWDALPSSSQNHLMLGHAEEWFYRGLAGIREKEPGYRSFEVRPAVVGDLTWVKAHLDCPYGRIESHWQRDGDKFSIRVTVPVNTIAKVYLPAGDPAQVTSGGMPVARVAGVKHLGESSGRAVFEVQPGTYTFGAEMSD